MRASASTATASAQSPPLYAVATSGLADALEVKCSAKRTEVPSSSGR